MRLTETQIQVRDMARQFADDVIRPMAEGLDRDERFPAELYKQMGDLGLFGIGVPEEMGGPGFDTVTYALVMEELSRGYASVADQCGLVELVSTLLVRHGTQAQRERWLGGLLSADLKAAYCITEPEAGTDVSGIRTTAVRDADGWLLNGGKIWIHNAPVADVAAGFQEAVADVLTRKAVRAATDLGVSTLLIAGGVAANSRLRELAEERCAEAGLTLRIPRPRLCTDNGAMIASFAAHLMAAGAAPSPLDVASDPGLPVMQGQVA